MIHDKNIRKVVDKFAYGKYTQAKYLKKTKCFTPQN